MAWILLFALLFLLTLSACLKVRKRLRRKRYLAACLSGLYLILFLGLILGLLNLLLGMYSYHRFSQGQQIAKVSLQVQGDHSALVWQPQNQASRNFSLTGQEWILGAKVLVWQPWLSFLGVDPVYDWEFLGARSSTQTLQLISLNSAPQWWSRWGRFLLLRFAILSIEGSAVYMPLTESATYCVDLTARGLSARPCE